MKPRLFPVSMLFAACWLPAQAPSVNPAAAPAQDKAYSSSIGFRYRLPADWESVGDNPSPPDARQQAGKGAAADAEMRGMDCAQTVLAARHGNPASVITVVALPFECFGEPMIDKDLPGFGRGAMEEIENSFDLSAPVTANYDLGTHRLWIERSGATVKGQTERAYTVETVCTILKKGAVCWMATAADADALRTFETGAVKLEGDSFPALVPPAAFGIGHPDP